MEGTCGEVADILGDPVALPRWWPSVYLAVHELAAPRPDGCGGRARLRTRGWLPYTLRWDLEVLESRYPHGFTIAASGDFDGRGVWTFAQDGRFVDVTYAWRVRAEKPLLRNLSFLLRPLFEANHRWAMAQGETSLRLELARRRTTSDVDLARIPAAPGPVTYSGAVLLASTAAVGGALFYLLRRARK